MFYIFIVFIINKVVNYLKIKILHDIFNFNCVQNANQKIFIVQYLQLIYVFFHAFPLLIKEKHK